MNRRRTLGLFLFVLTLSGQAHSDAAVILLEWSGTVEIRNAQLFGVTGQSAPYRFSLTYDTALAPAPTFTPAGSKYLHDIYSYSAEGIVATSLTFGSKTWLASDLTNEFNFGLPEPILFDADIASASPTRYFFNFGQIFSPPFTGSDGRLFLGGTVGSTQDYLDRRVYVFNDPADRSANGLDLAPKFTASVVPEPSTALTLLASLVALSLHRHRSSSGSRAHSSLQ